MAQSGVLSSQGPVGSVPLLPPTLLSGTEELLLSGKVSQLRDKYLAQSGAHSRCLINARWRKEGMNGGMNEEAGRTYCILKTTSAAAAPWLLTLSDCFPLGPHFLSL